MIYFLILLFTLVGSPASADPITDAIVTYLALQGVEATIATIVINTAIAVGLNYVASALFSSGASTASAVSGVSGSIGTGGVVPRSLVVGWYASAGSLSYANSAGVDGSTQNAYLTYVIALSDFPITSLQRIFVNDKACVFDMTQTKIDKGYPIVDFRVSGQDYLWVNFYDGTQTGVDAYLHSTFGADPNYPYDSNMVGTGVAYVIVTARLNSSLFSGFPRYVLEVFGAKLYDPRDDSSVSGGSGSQRFDDQTTWAFSTNPIIGIYNILRGVYAPTAFFNLALWSEDQSNAVYLQTHTTVPSTNNPASDGSLTACKLAEDNTTNTHAATQFISGLTDNADYTVSCEFKAVERSWVQFHATDKSGNDNYIFVNLATGAIGDTKDAANIQVVNLFDGWFRLEFTWNARSGANTPKLNLILATANTVVNYAGTTGDGFLVSRLQLVPGEAAEHYTRTTTVPAIVTSWLYGPQNLAPIRIPLASLFAAANECDITVTNADSTTSPQYQWGGEIAVSSQPIDVINAALMACNGRPAEVGGYYKFLAGVVGSSVLSITDNSIVISQQQKFTQFPSLSSLANGIAATYPEPASSWASTDAPALINLDLEAEDDNRELLANVNYGAVPYASQVQRLMSSALNEARKFRRHAFTLGPTAWILEPNDVIKWTSTRNSYINKLFRVDTATDNTNLDVQIAISEVDPSDYNFNTATDYQDQTIIPFEPQSIPDPPSTPSGFSVTLNSGQLTLTWNPVVSAQLTGYDLYYQDLSITTPIDLPLQTNFHGTRFTTNSVAPGTYRFFVAARDVYDPVGMLARGTPGMVDFTIAGGGGGTFTFNKTIAADTMDYDLGADATLSGWDGTQVLAATVTINAGIYVGASTTGAAFTVPVLPATSTCNITNNGFIMGLGGDGGSSGGNGSDGGLALSVAYATTIDNLMGTVAGGGGGGGGGHSPGSGSFGGGGGGGQGNNPGNGGSATPNAADGNAGTPTSAGSGGSPSGSGGHGGAGGGLATAGTVGSGTPHGNGGAAGNATLGNSNITWTNNGTRIGTLG